MKVDVVIVGAGVSGVPAAVAAARAGAKTLLLEHREHLGGTLLAGLGFPICGLFENDPSTPPRLLNEGLSREFFSTLSNEVSEPVFVMGRVYVCRCPVSVFVSIYERWLDEKNLTMCLGVTDLSVSVQADRITEIKFRTAGGALQTVEFGQVIDCTGSGAVVQQSGADQILPESCSLAGFSVRLRGGGSDDMLPIKVPYILRKAVDAGALPDYCAFTVFSPMSDGQALCKFSLPPDISREDIEPVIEAALRLLKQQIPAFSTAIAVEFSPAVLPREGARLSGESVLSAGDVRSGRRVDDCIARGGWPMEYWDAQSGVQYEYIQNGFSYDISERSLRSVNIRNLWAAGRLLSADSRALASARVMGTAIATGEAAGRAAVRELM